MLLQKGGIFQNAFSDNWIFFLVTIPNLDTQSFWFLFIFVCAGSSWLCISFLSEKAMAPHSSTLAWKIPWTEEPGRLQSMGSLRVGHDWETSRSIFTVMHWRRKWQPTPIFFLETPRDRGVCWAASVGLHRVGHNWSDSAAAAASRVGEGSRHAGFSCCSRQSQ